MAAGNGDVEAVGQVADGAEFEGRGMALALESADAAEDQLVRGERARLVETAHVRLARERNPERLRAVDAQLGQGDEGGVDGEAELHGELGRHHRSDDEGALEEQLVGALLRVVPPLHQHIARRSDGEDEEDEDEDEALDVVSGDAVGAVEDGADELPLVRLESSAQHIANTSAVRSLGLAGEGGTLAVDDLRAAEEEVETVVVELECALSPAGDGFLQLWRGLSREHGLVHDAGAAHEENVAGQQCGVALRTHHRHYVAWHQLGGAHRHPLAHPQHIHLVRRLDHRAERGEVAEAGLDDGGLEDEQHEEGEDGVVPVLVQAPEEHAEHLEHEERRQRLLLVELHELGARDRELVGAPVVLGVVEGGLVAVADGGVVLVECVRHREGRLHELRAVPEELPLAPREVQQLLASRRRGGAEVDDGGGALACDGSDLHMRGGSDGGDGAKGERGTNGDGPVATEDCQGMADAEYGEEIEGNVSPVAEEVCAESCDVEEHKGEHVSPPCPLQRH
mmetsp:Transcript_726/g.2584  ORF Transcript_726/g.2584 Transcript_726/m.2584 type:complete len:510 (+) Transcript_726:1095-2624(+)